MMTGIQEIINWKEMAICYLKAEMSRMLPDSNARISEYLKSLDSEDLNRMLYSTSVIIRANGMHDLITSDSLDWKLSKFKLDNLYLKGFHGIEVTKTLNTLDNNLFKLIDYLKNKETLSESEEELLKIRTYKKNDRLFGMLEKNTGRLRILDGGHRAVNLILNGVEEIEFYYFESENLDLSSIQHKVKAPKSIFFAILSMVKNSEGEIDIELFQRLINNLKEKYSNFDAGFQKYIVNEFPPDEEQGEELIRIIKAYA